MKCRKCGNEVDIGEVFCQKCGTAIQIVPDYNPLEDEIEVPIEEKSRTTLEEERRKRRRAEAIRRKKKQQKMMLIGMAVAIVLIVAAGIAAVLHFKKVNSYEYLYNLGTEAYAAQEYGKAVEYYRDAEQDVDNLDEDVELKLRMIDCYAQLGDYNRVVEMLLDVVNKRPTVKYYEQLMQACEEAGNTDLMNRILKDTQGTEIGEALSDYRTGNLTADIPGGEYHDYLTVTLKNSQAGTTIYYTTDGSEPTESSEVYSEPIVIEKVGTTTLRAIAVNEAGLIGEELNEKYTISLVVPDSPTISPDSGKYAYSQEIEILVPEGGEVYYTIDGTMPNKETSYAYTEPILMPVGNTIFSAIVVDKYGVASGVTKKNYECILERPFSYDAAVIKLRNYLVSVGIMSDLNGNRGNGERISVQFVELAQVVCAAPEGATQEECYIFTLRRTVDGETTTLGEMLYAVNTENGAVHVLTVDMEGNYSYTPEVPETESEKAAETTQTNQ